MAALLAFPLVVIGLAIIAGPIAWAMKLAARSEMLNSLEPVPVVVESEAPNR